MTLEYLFPGGKPKALALSYDDGSEDDRRLVDLFNHHGLKGTFHLNSGRMGVGPYLSAAEARTLYAGHEIACHSRSHPSLDRLPSGEARREICEDRAALEQVAGRPIRGLAYPNGVCNPELMRIAAASGISYARTIAATGHFGLPEHWLAWHPNCHHRDRLAERTDDFLRRPHAFGVMTVWGHAWNFTREHNWEVIEAFSAAVSSSEAVWSATMTQIHDYVEAVRGLMFSVNCRTVCNPSAQPVWLRIDGGTAVIASGAQQSLT